MEGGISVLVNFDEMKMMLENFKNLTNEERIRFCETMIRYADPIDYEQLEISGEGVIQGILQKLREEERDVGIGYVRDGLFGMYPCIVEKKPYSDRLDIYLGGLGQPDGPGHGHVKCEQGIITWTRDPERGGIMVGHCVGDRVDRHLTMF